MPEYSSFPGITVIKFTHWRRIKYYITGLVIFILIITACKKDEKIELPVVSTVTASNIGSTTALSGGEITQDGGGMITARGIVWGTINNPNLVYNKGFTNDGTGTGVYVSHLTGLSKNTTYYIREFNSLIAWLTPGATYHVRAFARNSMGISYGNQVSFSTPPGSGSGEIVFNPALTYGSVTDIDGNTYKTIQIGTQTWMAENLRTTKLKNGDPIPEVPDKIQWKDRTSGAYCNYNNEASLSSIYGRLYNWYAVNDTRNLAPEGWHVATDNDWTALADYLGGKGLAAYKLIETGTLHWTAPNTGATNESGFSALPGGLLLTWEGYAGIGTNSFWWSASEVDIYYGSYWTIACTYNRIDKYGYNKTDGYSVRCIKN